MQARRQKLGQQNPVALARAAAEYQHHLEQKIRSLQLQPRSSEEASNEQRVEAARRLATLRNLRGNDELSRVLDDLPDIINLGNHVAREGTSLAEKSTAQRTSEDTSEDINQNDGKGHSNGVSKGANRYLRLN